MSHSSASLRPQLDQAQKTLSDALSEACSSDVAGADTGELIRIEEVLAIANEAAKEAISVRRRIGLDDREQSPPVAATEPGVAESAESSGASEESHREIEDDRGVRWMTFAVYPSRVTNGRSSPLPEAFQRGWLAFDSGMETRRLAPIPEGWRDLSNDALRQLCDKAEVAPRRATQRDHPGHPGHSS